MRKTVVLTLLLALAAALVPAFAVEAPVTAAPVTAAAPTATAPSLPDPAAAPSKAGEPSGGPARTPVCVDFVTFQGWCPPPPSGC